MPNIKAKSKIDFSSVKDFPILNGLIKEFDKYTPQSEIRNENLNVKEIIGTIKGKSLRRMVNEDPVLIAKIDDEIQLHAINIPTSKERDYFIKSYNKEVLDKIDKYCKSVIDSLYDTFKGNFTNEDERNLSIKSLFKKWYQKFQ